MNALRRFEGQTIAIYGADEGAVVAANALRSNGANVYLWDERGLVRDRLQGTAFECTHPNAWNWQLITCIITATINCERLTKSHPVRKRAIEKNIEILTMADLFFETVAYENYRETKTVLITGAHGKSILASMVSHVLNASGRGASIISEDGTGCGMPFLAFTEQVSDVLIVEMPLSLLSQTTHAAPDIVAVTNLYPEPARAPRLAANLEKLFHLAARNAALDAFIIGVDTTITETLCTSLMRDENGLRSKIVPVSGESTLGFGVFSMDGHVWTAQSGKTSALGNFERVNALAGSWMNELASSCIAICLQLGLSSSQIIKALHTYHGLKGRHEQLGEKEGVCVIDDGHATSFHSVQKLLSEHSDVYWVGASAAVMDFDDSFVRENLVAMYGYGLHQADQETATEKYFTSAAMAVAAALYDARKLALSDPSRKPMLIWAPGVEDKKSHLHHSDFLTTITRWRQLGAA